MPLTPAPARTRPARTRPARTAGERGLTTAEYAIGVVAVTGIGGVLVALLTSTNVVDLLQSTLTSAFHWVLGR